MRTYGGRIDTAAKPLIAAAKSLGLGYQHVGGTFDGLLFLGEIVRVVDWKTPGKESLTPGQMKMVAKGCRIAFISTVPQLQLLAAEMRRDGLR